MYRNKGFGAHAHFHNKGSWIGWFQKELDGARTATVRGPSNGTGALFQCESVFLFLLFIKKYK